MIRHSAAGLGSEQCVIAVQEWAEQTVCAEETLLREMLLTPSGTTVWTNTNWGEEGIADACEWLGPHWRVDALVLVTTETSVSEEMRSALGHKGTVITVSRPGSGLRGIVFPNGAAHLLEYEPLNPYWDLDPDPDEVILASNMRVKLLESAMAWRVGLV